VEYTISYNPTTRHVRIFVDEVMIREVHGFPAEAETERSEADAGSKVEGEAGNGGEQGEGKGKVFVGVMGCSPLGKGTDATFSGFAMREGVRDVA
jgi:nicotinamide mononucleotide (NMN) deamidase PncC